MNLRTSFGGRLPMIWLVVLASAVTPAFAASHVEPKKLSVNLHQSPTDGKTPVLVSLGLYVTNLVAIDETRETFEVGGYLKAKWQDPRLALPADATAGSDQETQMFQTEDIWTPPIQAANAVSHKTESYFIEVDRSGAVSYVERFNAVLSNDLDLTKFPFDSQVLQFDYQPFVSAASAIQFASQALPSTGMTPDQHTELAAWRVLGVRYTAEKVASNGFVPPTGEALFQIVVQRQAGFYIWKIFLPLVVLTLIPAVVFWIDVKEFDWLLKVPITMLLSMVAFGFTITGDLPRIGYVTFMDAFFLAGFALCFLCILEITTVYIMQRNGLRSPAVRLHSAGRWAYPLAYCVVICILAFRFLA
jgi:hypothetical protein